MTGTYQNASRGKPVFQGSLPVEESSDRLRNWELPDTESPRVMKVALIHDFYQHAGGEDEVFQAEGDLLESQGHTVLRYTVMNQSIENMSRPVLAKSTIWNSAIYRDLRGLFQKERPAVAHFHNTFPLISPAAYYAARAEQANVVQTLHNFRLICPNGLLFRDGRPCEDCVGKSFPWPGVVHACYRNDRAASAVTAGMLGIHRVAGTWRQMVGMYIALSDFSREKFIAGGLPPERIAVKPNFLRSDPGLGDHAGHFGLYVGRLAPEKGLAVLQQAWADQTRRVRLKIVGGPVGNTMGFPHTEWLGYQSKERVFAEMKNASFLVFPSECYENCPMTIVEAFATGLPVIVSDVGSAAEMVSNHHTGLHFRASDATDLAAKVEWAIAHPEEMVALGKQARREFELKYTGERNYLRLMEVYEFARLGKVFQEQGTLRSALREPCQKLDK